MPPPPYPILPSKVVLPPTPEEVIPGEFVPPLPPGIKKNLNLSQKNKLATLQNVAQQLGIEIKKPGVKGHINKTKAELLSEIIDI